jgi:hypothetical protein
VWVVDAYSFALPLFRPVKGTPVLVVAAAALALGAGGVSSFVIQGDHKIGGYAVKADGSLRGAVREFGAPSSRRRRFQATACDVRWRDLGLRIEFYNLGGTDACSGAGRFLRATITSRRWRTAKGLRVGDSVARLRRLYPRATFRRDRFYGAGWWLVTRVSRVGTTSRYPGLQARVRSGRVSALVLQYPAGGD